MPEPLMSIKDAPDYFGLSSTSRDILALAARSATAPWVDPETFLRAVLAQGQRTQTATAGWLYGLLMKMSGGLLTLVPQKPGSGAQALAPELSAAFLKAKSARYRTSNRHQTYSVGLHHLLFGIFTEPTCQPGVESLFLSLSLTSDAGYLEREFIRHLKSSLEPGESWDEWLIIFGENGIMVEDRLLGPQQDTVEPSSLETAEDPDISSSSATPSRARAKSSPLPKSTSPQVTVPKEPPTPSPLPSTPSAPTEERVPTQADDPATQDGLGRHGFAVILAQHIRNFRQVTRSPHTGAFMLLVDGPWGSGKSSIQPAHR